MYLFKRHYLLIISLTDFCVNQPLSAPETSYRFQLFILSFRKPHQAKHQTTFKNTTGKREAVEEHCFWLQKPSMSSQVINI